MSVTYTIYRFKKISERETEFIDYFSDYDSFPASGQSFIRLYREDDETMKNLVDSHFAKKMLLPESVVDYNALFFYLGFAKEVIEAKKVHISRGNIHWMEFTDGTDTKSVEMSNLDSFRMKAPVRCIALKMEELWENHEACIYPDDKRVAKYISDIDRFQFVPISNSLLAKAEIPFLIFKRNKGKCFIEKS